jgi:hypothetical protein
LDLEAAAAKPKKDGCCSRRPSCLGSVFVKKALVTSSFLTFVRGMLVDKALATSSLLLLTSGILVNKALTTCSLLAGSLLAFIGGMLIKEGLAVSGLLFLASSLLIKMALVGHHLEAMHSSSHMASIAHFQLW